jgi:hypothetical protein
MAKSVQALIMTANLQPGTRFEIDQIFMLDDERMDALEDGRDAPLAPDDFWLDLHERERVIEDGALAIAIRRSWYHGPETPEYPLRMYTEPKRPSRLGPDLRACLSRAPLRPEVEWCFRKRCLTGDACNSRRPS